jgi:hypothetical protein
MHAPLRVTPVEGGHIAVIDMVEAEDGWCSWVAVDHRAMDLEQGRKRGRINPLEGVGWGEAGTTPPRIKATGETLVSAKGGRA